jgi:hypothetical protein
MYVFFSHSRILLSLRPSKLNKCIGYAPGHKGIDDPKKSNWLDMKCSEWFNFLCIGQRCGPSMLKSLPSLFMPGPQCMPISRVQCGEPSHRQPKLLWTRCGVGKLMAHVTTSNCNYCIIPSCYTSFIDNHGIHLVESVQSLHHQSWYP